MIKDQPIYFNKCFTNFEDYQVLAKRWDLEFQKISRGSFQGAINLIDLGKVQIGETFLSGVIIQQGLTPIGYRTFVIPADLQQQFKWFNKNINSAQLLVFPEDNIIDAISFEDFHVYTISIRKDYIEELINKFSLLNYKNNTRKSESVISLNKNYHYCIISFIKIIFRKIAANHEYLHSDGITESITEKLPEMLLKYIDKKKDIEFIDKTNKREKMLMNAVTVIANYKGKLAVKSLSSELGVSERTLEYAFKQYFGLSPKRYIKAVELNNFRHIIIKDNKSISKAAAMLGITHLGQLSADYKNQFGELPSKSILKKHKKSNS